MENRQKTQTRQQSFALVQNNRRFNFIIRQQSRQGAISISAKEKQQPFNKWMGTANIKELLNHKQKFGDWEDLAQNNDKLYQIIGQSLHMHKKDQSLFAFSLNNKTQELSLKFIQSGPFNKQVNAYLKLQKVQPPNSTSNLEGQITYLATVVKKLASKIQSVEKLAMYNKENIRADQFRKITEIETKLDLLNRRNMAPPQQNMAYQFENLKSNLTKKMKKVKSANTKNYTELKSMFENFQSETAKKIKELAKLNVQTQEKCQEIFNRQRCSYDNQELNKVAQMAKRIENMEKKILQTSNDIHLIKLKKPDMRKIMKQPKKQNVQQNVAGISQSQILDQKDIGNLAEWMGRKQIRLKLIYSAQKNGDSAKDFWKKCNEKGNTITVVKTPRGRRFGGFRKLKFKNEFRAHYCDQHAFLFSLDKAQKCALKNKDDGYVVQNAEGYLPYFGVGPDLWINNNCLKEGGGSKLGGSYEAEDYGATKKNEFFAGSRKFNITEVEIYTVNQ